VISRTTPTVHKQQTSVHVAAGLFLQRILGISVIFFSISFWVELRKCNFYLNHAQQKLRAQGSGVASAQAGGV
jgi:hypothetical protein